MDDDDDIDAVTSLMLIELSNVHTLVFDDMVWLLQVDYAIESVLNYTYVYEALLVYAHYRVLMLIVWAFLPIISYYVPVIALNAMVCRVTEYAYDCIEYVLLLYS